jgi:hypothetical protein
MRACRDAGQGAGRLWSLASRNPATVLNIQPRMAVGWGGELHEEQKHSPSSLHRFIR